MLLNNDLLFIVGSVIVGGIFTYTLYNNIFTTYNSKSLVNTLPNLDSINELPESSFPILQSNNLHKIDAGVQTCNTNVEIGVQADNIQVDVGVQTPIKSLWSTFKDWIQEIFSMNSSDVQTPTIIRVENWRDNLDSTQTVSTNTINSVVSRSNSNNLLETGESVSNLQSPVEDPDIIYHITDPTMLVNILREPGVEMENILELNQTIIKYNDVILNVDPSLIYFFI